MNNEFDINAAKDKDLEAFHLWKSDPTKKNLSGLMKQIKPLIKTEINKISGSLPEAALEAEAMKWAHTAIQTYDPSRNVKLSTHVVSTLRKVKRLNYKFRGGARRSEEQERQFGEFDTKMKNLEEDLGRAPTVEELAGHIGWKVKKTQRFLDQTTRDVFESASKYSTEVSRFDETYAFNQFLKTQLTREENAILLLIDKYPGDGRSSATAIANGMGISIHRYNYLRRKLIDKVAKLQEEYYSVHHEK